MSEKRGSYQVGLGKQKAKKIKSLVMPKSLDSG